MHFPQNFVLKVYSFIIQICAFIHNDYFDKNYFSVICIIREIIRYLSKINDKNNEILQNVT